MASALFVIGRNYLKDGGEFAEAIRKYDLSIQVFKELHKYDIETEDTVEKRNLEILRQTHLILLRTLS